MNTVLIDEQSTDGLLKVTITANRELKNIEHIKSIKIHPNIINICLLIQSNLQIFQIKYFKHLFYF